MNHPPSKDRSPMNCVIAGGSRGIGRSIVDHLTSMGAQGVDGGTMHEVQRALEIAERREMHSFMHYRLSKTVFEWITGQSEADQPRTILDCIHLVDFIGFVGVVVLLWPQFSLSTGTGSAFGSLAILAAAMSFAVSLVLIRRLPQAGSPVLTARNILFCGTVELGAVLLLMRQPLVHHPLQSSAVIALLAQGVLAGGVVYVLYVRLVNVAGATFAGFANYLVPVVGVFLGVFFLKDHLPLSAYLSILIIALAIFAVEWRPARLDSDD